MSHNNNINKLFVEIFQLLDKKSSDNRYDILATKYGTTTIDEQTLLDFSTQYSKNNKNIEKLSYFNTIDIKNLLNKQEFEEIESKFAKIYELSQKILMEQYTKVFDVQDMLNNPCLKQLFSMSNINPKDFEKQINKNADFQKIVKRLENIQLNNEVDNQDAVESMINLVSNLFQSTGNEIFTPLKEMFSKEIFKEHQEKMKDVDTTAIFEEIEKRIRNEHPEIIEEFKKYMKMFDLATITSTMENFQHKLVSVNWTNFESVANLAKEYIDDNPSLQNIIWKFHMSLESGLINLQKIKEYGKIVIKIACDEFAKKNLINPKDIDELFKLIENPASFNPTKFFPKRGKKLTKEQRQNKRIKNNRRKRRKQLKNQHNRKK